MFLSAETKAIIDNRVRRDLPPLFAEQVIAANREMKIYEIQRLENKTAGPFVVVGDLIWTTVKTVICDWDDAISHKEAVAAELGIHPCHLRIISET